MAQHSESTVRLPDHKEPRCAPVCWAQLTGKMRAACSHLSKSLTLHQLGLTTLVYPYTTHLSGSKCSACVYIGVKGWHPLLTSAHWVPSTSQFRQRLTSVGIGHARLNNNLPCSPTSPSRFFARLYFHTATLCLSQGLGLATAPTATEEEGENSYNTKHRASAYSGTELEFEIRCKSPSGIIALVTG